MEKKKTRWKPKDRERYYAISNIGFTAILKPEELTWRGDNYDEQNFRDNSCFRTKREASAVCKQLNAAIKKILKSH